MVAFRFLHKLGILTKRKIADSIIDVESLRDTGRKRKTKSETLES